MLKQKLYLAFVVVALMVSCKKEKAIYPREPHTKCGPFYVGNTLKFYFIDKYNSSLIKMHDTTTFPLSFIDSIQQPIGYEPFPGGNGYLYNENCDEVRTDNITNKNYWSTSIRGICCQEDYQYYVRINENDIDTLKVKFRFVYENIVGASSYAYIDELYYNNYLILHDEGTPEEYKPESITVRKTDGQTLVTFNE